MTKEKPSKTIDTLVDDIFSLFDPKQSHVVDEDNLNTFVENMRELVRNRFMERENGDVLRFSSLGRPDRQIWYMSRDTNREELSAKTYFKFLYGDVIEQLLLFLAKEAGHSVTHEQEEIEVDGVKGHLDAVIDGVTVDVKSASPYSFQKFKSGKLFEDDPFGYVQQLSGYATVVTPESGGAFLAFNKVDGDICVLPVGPSIVEDYEPGQRIAHLKQVIKRDTLPPRCYEDVEDGKSGNRKLGTNCSYCAFKSSCWPNLRTFLYSSGPRFLTTVRKVPDVYEVRKDEDVPIQE